MKKLPNKLAQESEDRMHGRMALSSNRTIQVPLAVVARRLAEEDAKILKVEPVSEMDAYLQDIVKGDDWIVREQPSRKLPLGLTELLSMELRDEGNELIEETRALNNRYAGCSMRAVRMQLFSDIELMELRDRVLDWCGRVMKRVLYKRRREIENTPVVTYEKLFNAIIRDIDTRIAFGDDRMYQEVWSWAMDRMGYQLIEGCFLNPAHIVCRHSSDTLHLPDWQGECLRNANIARLIGERTHLYGVGAALYCRDVVLKPLAAALAADQSMEAGANLQKDLDSSMSNLLEAFPYLCASKRTSRYNFPIAGTTCVASFRFLGPYGIGTFMFFDSEEDRRSGIETNSCRGGLTIDSNGSMGCLMHPWLTIEGALGTKDALRVSRWLIGQVHDRVVEDYLKIGRYFLHQESKNNTPEPGALVAEVANDLVVYAGWAKKVQELMDSSPDSGGDTSTPPDAVKAGAGPFLPTIRRSRFFKALRACGVDIVQGKGSEVKLLRGSAHPFRLGSHYGPNPAIPSFLAGQILKRLEITQDEWASAVEASRI